VCEGQQWDVDFRRSYRYHSEYLKWFSIKQQQLWKCYYCRNFSWKCKSDLWFWIKFRFSFQLQDDFLDALEIQKPLKQVGGYYRKKKKPIYILKQLVFKPRRSGGIKAFIRDPTRRQHR
jgi:hypothetical protein